MLVTYSYVFLRVEEVPEEIKPRSLTILKEPYMREYDEDITSIYNRCS